MKTKIARWGNSLALRLPAEVVRDFGLREGQIVELTPNKPKIEIATERQYADGVPVYTLQELVAEARRLGPENESEMLDWGPDRGSEILPEDEYSRAKSLRTIHGAMLPEAGDVAWVEFDPVRGTEQAGRRPGLVISELEYHQVSTRALVCPITSRARPWPFNIVIPDGLSVHGVILVDQARMVHRPSRLFGPIGRLPLSIVGQVRGVLATLAGIGPTAAAQA